MTEYAQLQAIALACPNIATQNEEGDWVWKNRPIRKFFTPDTDLNAVRAAVGELFNDHESMWRYLRTLKELVAKNYDWEEFMCVWSIAHATPKQCSEAMLRTLNLWVES